MARTASVDNNSIQKTADSVKQLVELNKESAKQTKWLIALTIIIAILTLIMATPIVINLFKN